MSNFNFVGIDKNPLPQEKIDDYIKTSIKEMSCIEIKQMIKNFIKNNEVSKQDTKIFNKIISNPKILKKIKVCIDGSYLKYRLFYNKNMGGFLINDYNDETCFSFHSQFKNKLNFLFTTQDTIFLQLMDGEESKRINDILINLCNNKDYTSE